jgi:hypothetical protein
MTGALRATSVRKDHKNKPDHLDSATACVWRMEAIGAIPAFKPSLGTVVGRIKRT